LLKEIYPALDFRVWFGIFAPALTPQSIATARGEALNNVARDPELRQMQCGIAMASNPGTPEDLATPFAQRPGAVENVYPTIQHKR
jgi:tripartite-type tricarboxylate transporter receptor subunit TctC